jgi:hypothetical protein
MALVCDNFTEMIFSNSNKKFVPLLGFVRIISGLLKLSNSLFGIHDGKRIKAD